MHERLSPKRESRAQSRPALFDKASNVSEADTSGAGYRSPFTYPCQARAYGRGGGVGLGRGVGTGLGVALGVPVGVAVAVGVGVVVSLGVGVTVDVGVAVAVAVAVGVAVAVAVGVGVGVPAALQNFSIEATGTPVAS